MMTNTVDTTSDERVPAMITKQARAVLPVLTELLKDEKGVNVSFYEAASLAIIEMAERKARAKERREQRKLATAA